MAVKAVPYVSASHYRKARGHCSSDRNVHCASSALCLPQRWTLNSSSDDLSTDDTRYSKVIRRADFLQFAAVVFRLVLHVTALLSFREFDS